MGVGSSYELPPDSHEFGYVRRNVQLQDRRFGFSLMGRMALRAVQHRSAIPWPQKAPLSNEILFRPVEYTAFLTFLRLGSEGSQMQCAPLRS